MMYKLLQKMNKRLDKKGNLSNISAKVLAMSELLGGSTILLKQQYDVVASRNSDVVVVVKEEGSARRCGGQGDVLAGSLGVAIHWANLQAKHQQPVRFEWMTLTHEL